MSPFSVGKLIRGDATSSAERGRFPELEPVGVVDIGSNSVRLVVYEGAVRAPTPLFNEKELCGLGRSLASTGRLGEDAIARALTALQRFRSISEILGVKHLKAVATAAVRDAADGAQFVAQATDVLGTEIEVLSGEREAQLAARGIMMGFNDTDGIAGDLGGGSLELTHIGKGAVRNAATLPLGALRLADVSDGRMSKAMATIATEIGHVPWLRDSGAKRLYAVGGSWRALAKLHMAQTDYPIRVMHGYSIPADEAIAFCEKIRRTKRLDQVPHFEVVARQRRDTLPYGAAAMEQVLKTVRPESVVFSVFGIREGVLYEHLDEDVAAQDPLIAFCESYARLRSRSAAHAHELVAWTEPLFAKGKFAETDEDRRLRHAACLLSDIGWRAHPDYRGEQSLNVVAHAALTGLDHAGRLFLALTVYARHAGIGETNGEALSPKLRELVPRRMMLRARVLAAALRAAHLLSCGMAGVIPRAPVAVTETELILTVPQALSSLVGDRLERRFQSLAQLLGLEFRSELVD
ncbi:MAG: exopolyphosphatase [Pseudomonadota bacterium]